MLCSLLSAGIVATAGLGSLEAGSPPALATFDGQHPALVGGGNSGDPSMHEPGRKRQHAGADPAAVQQSALNSAQLHGQFASLLQQQPQRRRHEQQQQRQQEKHPVQLAPAGQLATPAGSLRSSAARAVPAVHWAAELWPAQPPPQQFTHLQAQLFAPPFPQQPGQPLQQPSRVPAQQVSAPHLPYAPQSGSGFGSEISGLTPSWLGASLPLSTEWRPAQQAQQGQQAQRPPTQQAKHGELHGLLTDEEVEMLLDDLLEDPLMLPDLGPDFRL